MNDMRAPFIWFGGKSRVAHLIWDALGDVDHYVEPFFGSGASAAVRCQLVRQLGINIQNPVDLLSGRGDVALQPQQIPTDQSATPFLRDRGRIWSASQMRAAA